MSSSSSRVGARGSDPVTASALLHEADALWRVPTLGDLALSGAAADRRSRLDGLRVAAEDRIQADLELGRQAVVVAKVKPRLPGSGRCGKLGILQRILCRSE